MHGRSRSELTPSSPRMEGVPPQGSTQESSTVTISSREYLRKHQLVDESGAAAIGLGRPGSSLAGSYGRRPSESSETSPSAYELGASRPGSAMSGSLRSRNASHSQMQMQPQSSAALRQRMLYSSSSSSANASPDLLSSSSSSQTPSPPLSSSAAAQSTYRHPPSSSSSSLSSSQDREQRRKDILEETASRLAHAQAQDIPSSSSAREREERRTSPKMVPYAKRNSLAGNSSGELDFASSAIASSRAGGANLSRSASGATVNGASSRGEEATMQPTRPGSSTAMYRDREEPPQPQQARPRIGQSASFGAQQRQEEEYQPPRSASAMSSYADENDYRPPHQQQQQQQAAVPFPSSSAARTPLAETYRANPAPQHQPQSNGYPKDRVAVEHYQQQQRQPSPPSLDPQPQYSMPPPHQSMSTATPSMTHQQQHYVGQQVAEQRGGYHQQPYQGGQQTPMYAGAGGMGQQEYQVPIQKPVKKGPAVIVVSHFGFEEVEWSAELS